MQTLDNNPSRSTSSFEVRGETRATQECRGLCAVRRVVLRLGNLSSVNKLFLHSSPKSSKAKERKRTIPLKEM